MKLFDKIEITQILLALVLTKSFYFVHISTI